MLLPNALSHNIHRLRTRTPVLWINLTLCTGIILSICLFLFSQHGQRRELQERADSIVHEQLEKLHIVVLRSMEVLHSIAALHQVEGGIERQRFHDFVQNRLTRQPELQALSWNPVVPAAHRSSFETANRASGLPGYVIREQSPHGGWIPALPRTEHTPVQFIEPLLNNSEALGFDLNSDDDRRKSIELSRDTGEPVATRPIHLTQASDHKTGFLVVLPVYQSPNPHPGSIEERRKQIAGFAVAVFKVVDLVQDSFQELENRGVTARLTDSSPVGELLYGTREPALSQQAWLDVAGRKWTVSFDANPSLAATIPGWQPWIILSVGLLFTALTTSLLFSGWQRNAEMSQSNALLYQEITQRKAAEAAAAAASQAKSDFLASMSHEIRTPLNAVLGYSQILQRDPHLSPEQKDSIKGITTGGHHLLGLINEILDLSKIEAGRMEVYPVAFDLHALGESLVTTCKPLCAQKRLSFRFVFEGGKPCHVRGDESKLRQILINLIGNAIKFTPTGEVCLAFRKRNESDWLFEIIDTGHGIPDEERPHIFKPFHRGHGAQHLGGTGLGLAIAQKQVELLGGQLQLDSERGFGSRFHFTIPLEPTSSFPLPPTHHVTQIKSPRNLRVLIVDDHPENRDVFEKLLRLVGCETLSVATGAEALTQSMAFQPDVALVDLLLPDIRGTVLTQKLAHPPHPIPVIMHSASALAEHQRESLDAGCIAFLSKPVDAERIYETLRTKLGVEFEYSEPGPLDSAPSSLTAITIPEALHARLHMAAELHSTTALKSGLLELRALGAHTSPIADRIRNHMRSYDMDAIQRLLEHSVTPDHNRPSPSPTPKHDQAPGVATS